MGTVKIGRVAVIGAGVMGAQIAAHCINAGIPTVIYDVPATGTNDLNTVAKRGLERMARFKPSPLAYPDWINRIDVCNYETDLQHLAHCHLIIEAVAERMEVKKEIYAKIAPHCSPHAIIASNTSGLSIHELAAVLPETLRSRFCGMHFFNPPRYMKLVELIPHESASSEILDYLEHFLVSELGKGVVRAYDTPNFIANRVGVFSLLSIIHHAFRFELNPAIVDKLTGVLIGRPKSATFRTLDLVGLDVFAHVVQNMADRLPQDPWHFLYALPDWLTQLMSENRLGQKTGKGVYTKQGKDFFVYDPFLRKDVSSDIQLAPELLSILNIPELGMRLRTILESPLKEAQFISACLKDLFHYCAYHGATIANNVRDIDRAMRWGFGWKQGPFELWQRLSWDFVSDWLSQEMKQKKTMSSVSLPNWVKKKAKNGVYQDHLSFSLKDETFTEEKKLFFYEKQYFPETFLNQSVDEGKMLWENNGVRLWEMGPDRIAILSFKTKKNVINADVLTGILESVRWVDKNRYVGLILWQRHGEHFSYGADLKTFSQLETTEELGQIIDLFHQAGRALRYCSFPVIAAIKGMVLGGTCELVMHCDRVIAAFETYIGLVETGVGLIPGGGGCKEFALKLSKNKIGFDPYKALSFYFQQLTKAEISSNAYDAQYRGFLKETDIVVFNSDELLYTAKQAIHAMLQVHYHPPIPQLFPVLGRTGIAKCQSIITNFLEGHFISSHDALVAVRIADLLCGGQLETGTLVHENWILKLEREAILSLLMNPKTRERIEYTLKYGKPLRN